MRIGGTASGVCGAGGHCHQEEPEQERPEGYPVGLSELALDYRAPAARRGGSGPARVRDRLPIPPLGVSVLDVLEATRRIVRGVLRGRGREPDASGLLVAGILVRALEATRPPLGLGDLALPLEEHGFATHLLLVILRQDAGSGCLHQLSFVSPAGLAVGLALKELRFAVTRDSPPAKRPSGSPAPLPIRGFGLMDAAMLPAQRRRRTENRRKQRGSCESAVEGGYWPATCDT